MEDSSDNSLPNIRIVFFDLDYTLCGYWDASKAALRTTFETHSVNGHSPEEMVQEWAAAFREFSPALKSTSWYASYLRKGEPTRTEQMRLTLKRVGIDDESLAKEIGDYYAEERNRNLKLFPESLPVLDVLKERYPLGLITNGPADIQREEIETLGIGHYFQHVYIEGEMGRGKPLPEVFEQIASDVQQPPERILFVGNSYAHDVRPALEAGWHALWIRRDSDIPPSADHRRALQEEMPAGAPAPDAIIHGLGEVLTLLGIEPGR